MTRDHSPSPKAERLSLFSRTGFRLCEEDRATNAMMVTLQHATTPLAAAFIRSLGCAVEDDWPIQFSEHVQYDQHSTIDAEMKVAGRLVVAVENKIYPRQLDDSDQARRYLRLLAAMKENRRLLLLISPDEKAPQAARIPGQSDACSIKWLPWVHIHSWFQRSVREANAPAVLDRYLVGEFTAYIEHLGLAGGDRHIRRRPSAYQTKLDGIIANATTECILLQIAHSGSVYGRQISRNHGVYIRAVQRQLSHLERNGVLRPRRVGKTEVYVLDEHYPYAKQLMELVHAAYEAMSPAERAATLGD